MTVSEDGSVAVAAVVGACSPVLTIADPALVVSEQKLVAAGEQKNFRKPVTY